MEDVVKTTSTEKRTLLGACVLIFLLFGSVTVLALLYFMLRAPAEPTVIVPPPGDITVTGSVVCLPHRDTSGEQTLECAYGIKDSEGRYFSLGDNDPEYRILANLPMNETITVKGFFTPQEDPKYQSIGIVEIVVVTSETKPLRATLQGTYVCVPRLAPDIETNECFVGIQIDDGVYYALDFALMSMIPPQLHEGDIFSASGVVVSFEKLPVEIREHYPVVGMFSVTDSVDIVETKEVTDECAADGDAADCQELE